MWENNIYIMLINCNLKIFFIHLRKSSPKLDENMNISKIYEQFSEFRL